MTPEIAAILEALGSGDRQRYLDAMRDCGIEQGRAFLIWLRYTGCEQTPRGVNFGGRYPKAEDDQWKRVIESRRGI